MSKSFLSNEKKICRKCGRILKSSSKKCKFCNDEDVISFTEYSKLVYLYKYSSDAEKEILLHSPEYEYISQTDKFKSDIEMNNTQKREFTVIQKIIGFSVIMVLLFLALYKLQEAGSPKDYDKLMRELQEQGNNIDYSVDYNDTDYIGTSEKYKDTVRCYYCGKVIRSNGVNIHGTPKYNGGVLECDYCGHSNSIQDD